MSDEQRAATIALIIEITLDFVEVALPFLLMLASAAFDLRDSIDPLNTDLLMRLDDPKPPDTIPV